MHVRHLPGWKAEIAEDHILDPAAQECIAVRTHLARLFFNEIEKDGEVVHPE